MAKFLTTLGVSSKIEEIMIEAQSSIYLVSPFLQISRTFFERLVEASSRNVHITIVYGKDELNPNEYKLLENIKNIKLFYLNNLHAKCYFNESKMVITSMNMYEYSEKNNREMGVFIDKNNDQSLFDNAKKETLSIIKLAQPSNTTSYKISNNKISNQGYCIRCRCQIPLNPSRPYCLKCFSIWNQFQNPEFLEYNCHLCGNQNQSSMMRPVCYSCYQKL